MKTIREVSFDAVDTLKDVSNMLILVDKCISEVDIQGEEISIRGSSSILWSVVTKLENISNELSKSLKETK